MGWLPEFSAYAEAVLAVLAYIALGIAMVGLIVAAIRMVKGWWDSLKR